MILTKMKETAEAYLGKTITETVITVPAYFNFSQRQATRDAGTISGMNVLRMISEPAAAAIAYGFGKKNQQEQNILIFDWGGGTLDVSIVALQEGVLEVKAIAGDTQLGGIDFDNKLIEYCCDYFINKKCIDIRQNPRALRRLRTQCELAKRKLSSTNETTIEVDSLGNNEDFSLTITRAKFEELCMSILKEFTPIVEKTLKDAGKSKNQINEIVLVGGSTRIPKVQEILRDYFNGKELNKSINPDEAITYGAAIQAAILTGKGNKQVQDMVLLDVTPFSLGIETPGGVMNVIIPRNTIIPIKKSEQFTTYQDNAFGISVLVFEGERQMTKDCRKLGQFDLNGISPAPRGVPQICISFNIDHNGLINITAENMQTMGTNQITITNDNGGLSKVQIEKLIKDNKKYNEDDYIIQQRIEALIRLQEIAQSITNTLQDFKLLGEFAVDDKIEVLVEKTNKWIHANPNADTNDYKTQLKSLEEAFQQIKQKLEQAQTRKKNSLNQSNSKQIKNRLRPGGAEGGFLGEADGK